MGSHQIEIRFPLLPGQSGASTARSVASEGHTLPFTTRPVWRKYRTFCRTRRKYAFLYYPASLAQVPHVLSHQKEMRFPLLPGHSGASTARSVASEGNTLPFTTRPVWRKYRTFCRTRRKYASLSYPASLAQVPHVLSHQKEIRFPLLPGQSGASTARSVASEGNTLSFTTRPVWRKYRTFCRIRKKYAFFFYPASLAQVPDVLSHQK